MLSTQNTWKPVPHTYISDEALRTQIDTDGYAILPALPPSSLDRLQRLYSDTHQFENGEGGMFYSVYSQDLGYRKRIHDEIGEILKPYLDTLVSDYKMMLNSYIVKASGPKSEFYVHQDTTGLDEFKFSSLSLWIPLQDITEQNGAMCIMPGSHKLFSPYRGISFPAPYDNIHSAVRKYLKPLFLKAGEVLVFDNRIVHNSMPNLSGSERVVVISGVFPEEATLRSCWKDVTKTNSKIEVFEHEEDYLLTNPSFLIDCHVRPKTGKVVALVDDEYPMLSEAELDALFAANNIQPVHYLPQNALIDCNMIVEPLSVNNTNAAHCEMPEPAAK